MPAARSILGPVLALGCIAVAAAGPVVAILAWQGGHFASPARIVLYGALPLLLAAAAVGLLFAGHAARLMAAAYGAAFAAALLGAELYLSRQPAAGEGSADPALAARAAGERAYPHLCGQNAFVEAGTRADSIVRIDGVPVFPVTGLSNNRIFHRGPGWVSDTVTDEHGFNNPPGQWTKQELPLLLVGDSFTFGADVPFGSGFADRLRERFGATVNLGCGGNGPLLELAALAEYGPLLRPRTVVWAYFEGNDLTKDIVHEQRAAPQLGYLDGKSQNLHAQQPAIERAMEAYLTARVARAPVAAAQPSWPSLREILSLSRLRTALGLSYGFRPAELALFRHVMATAQATTAAWGGNLVFVYLPGEVRFATALGRLDADGYRGAVVSTVAGLGIPVVDLAEVFARQAAPRSLFSGHYTVEGYALVAAEIAARIETATPR